MTLLLASCATVEPVPAPPVRPAPVVAVAAPPPQPSLRSESLARYYARLQADLLTQGLLRRDGGGPDTPFSADDLARNFEAIAFYDEYDPSAGLARRGSAGLLRRWSGPVRVAAEFGASVPAARREQDTANLRNYAARLARVTGHPIVTGRATPNFHVLFMGEDDKDQMLAALRRIAPSISPQTMQVFMDLPRSIHCLVVAFSGGARPQNYTRAIALVRAEHPDLVRLSCIHEEVAQGLGLANDSPAARPSIFNDDDEFALLTNHDELLLRMLYDPRLTQGMSAEQARPVLRIIARELMGQAL
ncbi:MAG: DUF2927 domain-containing protein [Rhodobacteraceae bacterium]|nr:DUF2927 domain-containing protein [Paracoccaceae bacterium]